MEIVRYATAAISLLGFQFAAAQDVPKLSSDLHEIANRKSFAKAVNLSNADLASLRKNWFVVAPSEDYYLYSVFGQNDYEYVPSLVTADNAVQLLHVVFDSMLEEIETTKLSPGVRKMSAALLTVAIKDWKAAAGTPMKGPAAKNVAYFGVADRLSGGKDPIPASVLPMVTKTLAIVQKHGGFSIGPIFPYEIDYSQFVPRGHYTHTEVLRRYFQTMMWFGLTPLSAPNKPGESLEPIQQALLMSHELSHSDQLARWDRMYDVTTMLMGPANHATPIEAEVCAKKVFGPSPKLADWGDVAKVKEFIDVLAKARPPVFMEDVEFPISPNEVQVRFMGQRSIPDSYILQTLSSLQRKKPSPLDIMASLGSASALRILNASPKQYNPKDWPDYLTRRARLTEEFASKPSSQWSSDIYWSWLDCLRALTSRQEAAGQPFLKTQAWADKSLYTALASWTEMRHDTILYAQQSVAAEQGEDGDRAPNRAKGYIEPNLTLYSRMKALVVRMESELDKRSYLNADLRGQFDRLRGLLDFFLTVTGKEIARQPLSEAEYARIRAIEADFEDLTQQMMGARAGGYANLSPDDMDPALVADFHTADNAALEAGVGRDDHVYAVVRVEGKLYLMRGSSLSYYEFERPSSDRMTDHAWKQWLENGKVPPRPSWIRSFFVNNRAKEQYTGP